MANNKIFPLRIFTIQGPTAASMSANSLRLLVRQRLGFCQEPAPGDWIDEPPVTRACQRCGAYDLSWRDWLAHQRGMCLEESR